MKLTLRQELPLIGMVSIPFIYLAYIWNDLPDKVPMHWNLVGEIDRYGSKGELLIIPILLPLLAYIMMILIPKIDPKDKIKNMGSKYQSIKLVLIIFMSCLAVFLINISKEQSLGNSNYIIIFLGALIMMIGNYFKTIKANYFIGIRTPWTLESEVVWNETHKMAGMLWFLGGLAIILHSIVYFHKSNFAFLIVISIVITLVPVVYSYFRFRKHKTL